MGAQPVPHASKMSQLISLTTTPTQLPEDYTPPLVTEPELRMDSATTHPHLTTLISTTQLLLPQLISQITTQRCSSNSQSHNQLVPLWPNSQPDPWRTTEVIRKSKQINQE